MDAMFCHTCWNLQSCCTCHMDERLLPPSMDEMARRMLAMAEHDIIEEAEEITRQAADR